MLLFPVNHHEATIILNIFCSLVYIKENANPFEMFTLCFCVSKT